MIRQSDRTTDAVYDHPIWYDILATPGTSREVDVLQAIARRCGCGGANELWLEPACGTGRYLRVLAGRGQRVQGFDLAEPMIDYASSSLSKRRLGRRAKVFRADMADFESHLEPGSVDFAFNTFSSIRHLQSDRQLIAHLTQMSRVLRPDAVYLVGHSLHRSGQPSEEDVWIAQRGRCRITLMQNYLPPEPGTSGNRTETVICHMMIEKPSGVTHLDEVYRLRTYTQQQWLKVLSATPLRRLQVLDASGRPGENRDLPYQYEVLGI